MAAAFFVGVAAALAQQSTPPATTPPPSGEIRKAMVWKRFEYVCEGHAEVIVYLRDQTAKVRYADDQHLMKQILSADGNRYSDGKVVWWSKGNGGFLQEDKPDGNGAMLVKDCKLIEPEKRDPGVLTGTVTYRERIALPSHAAMEVSLQGISRQDVFGPIVAEQRIAAGGKQVPIPFELKFDPARIDPTYRYRVSARILVDGQLRWASDNPYPVLTSGSSASGVEIVVKPVPAKK